MGSKGRVAVVAIIVIALVIVIVVALVLYEESVRATDQIAQTAAANAAKTAGKVPKGKNKGGGGPGNGGSNAGGVAGNTSWPSGGGLDPYYAAQFPSVSFVPGKGFVMPVMNQTISPNSKNTWLPSNVGQFPNTGKIPFNSLSFDMFMESVNLTQSPAVHLVGESWDGEHTWCDSYAVTFANFGIQSLLDSTSSNWSPYFMTSDISQALSITVQKETGDFQTTSITTDRLQPNFSKKYWDIHSAQNSSILIGSEILDSVSDATASDKSYFVSLEFTLNLEIRPNEQKTFTQTFTQQYNPTVSSPILIQTPGFFLFNVFFNKNYSYLPKDDSASSANPMLASMVMSNNSFVNVVYSRGYNGQIINSVTSHYPLSATNTFCVDYVTKGDSVNPEFLKNSDNHVISFAVPVPYVPKQFDTYLQTEIASHPDIVFDMNSA